MRYIVNILRRAQKQLARLPLPIYRRVVEAIFALALVPRPPGALKLTGRPGWRIRVGDVRVIYEIDDEKRIVTILDIGHRRDIYRRGKK